MSGDEARALYLWLPPMTHFAATAPLRTALVRADARAPGAQGFLAGLRDYFAVPDGQLAVGALTREFLAHDAGDGLWLAADPAWARPDINGIRLMACGHLGLDQAQAEALAAPLQALLAEDGMRLEVSTPDHWHVCVPVDVDLPEFSAPEQGMGEDLSAHMPQGPAGKRWRLLENEIQVLLHQNPLNAERHARRRPPVNMLWLWGGGRLPEKVDARLEGVVSSDLVLSALAQRAGIRHQARGADAVAAATAGWLVDLQDLPAADIEATWWPKLAPRVAHTPIAFHFASGERWLRRPWHRYRVWRRIAH